MAEDSELRARSAARLGTTLKGKYRLDRVIGIGGMAVVYAATHRNQKQFAVKMLHAELSIRDDIRTRFLREGYAANSLKHPGAVAALDDDVAEDGSAFLVMELLEGDGLESVWEKSGGRMSPRAVMAIGHQLLDVLAAAHAKGIVHRDIKPPNLFLLEDGTVKVMDFGIARVRDVAASGAQGTGSGMLLGTPAYMAPEQALAKSREIDGQTDVWAAGATLFTLLSGKLVHEGENAAQLMIKAATTPARSVSAVAPSAPAEVVQIIDRALAFEKAARWPSAVVMRDAIRDTYQAMFGEAVSRAPLASLMEEHSRRSLAVGVAHAATEASDAQNAARSGPESGGVSGATVPAPAQGIDRAAGGGTPQPVSKSRTDSLPGRSPRGRGLRFVLFGLALVAGAGVVVLPIALRHDSGPGPAGGGAPQASPLQPPTQAPPAPLQSVDAAQVEPVVTTAKVDVSPSTSTPPPPRSTMVPHPPPPPSTRPNCNPPYTIDSTGTKHYKRECNN
jgi:tRNA A-37 threonylcarbamoyl transferase component Bud32